MENYSINLASYTVGPDAYRHIVEKASIYGKNAVVVGGRKAMAAAKNRLLAGIETEEASGNFAISEFIWYGTECTWENARKIAALDSVKNADMIFAVGGGKAVDTVKLVSLLLDKPFFTFPTIASNCAASSALSIVYHADGSFDDFVHLPEPAKHVFLDTQIMAEAPEQFLWAGIGDTYAKYYEVSVSAKGEELEHFKAMGVNLSRMCMETLLAHGQKAMEDNANKLAGYDFTQVALGIIITTGWVSTLVAKEKTMDYNGGVAHAFFYGLCNLPGFDEDHLHGVVVGFGCLILLLIDGQEEECERLKAFNRKVNLPTSLAEVGVTYEQVASVAESICADEDLDHYPYKVTAEMILDAAKRLEK